MHAILGFEGRFAVVFLMELSRIEADQETFWVRQVSATKKY